MRKKKTGGKRSARRAAPIERQDGGSAGVSRRDILASAQTWAIAAAVLGGASWFAVDEVCASVRDHDLSRIGQGVAMVVQIHDPQCPQCIALQNEALNALSAFDDDELQYVIANIRSSAGQAFARSHGAGHVTLILFDGEGNRRDVLVGQNSAEALERIFRRHVRQSQSRS